MHATGREAGRVREEALLHFQANVLPHYRFFLLAQYFSVMCVAAGHGRAGFPVNCPLGEGSGLWYSCGFKLSNLRQSPSLCLTCPCSGESLRSSLKSNCCRAEVVCWSTDFLSKETAGYCGKKCCTLGLLIALTQRSVLGIKITRSRFSHCSISLEEGGSALSLLQLCYQWPVTSVLR